MSTIKTIWQKIWGYLKPILTVKKIWGFLSSKLFLIMLVLILFILIGRSCSKIRDLERISNMDKQNITALTDTIKTEKTKSGKQQVTIAAFITSTKELEKLNKELYQEIKDQKGSVISLNKIVFQLKQDTSVLRARINYLESIITQPIQINDTTYKISWKLVYDWDSTNYDIYKGQTFIGVVAKRSVPNLIMDVNKTFNNEYNNEFNTLFDLKHYKTEITERISQVDMTFGQEIVGKQLRVFVNTGYPGFSAKSLQGWMIDPNTDPYIKKLMKKTKWIPNTWSVGIGPSFGYNIFSSKIYLGVGVNINYNILQW
jgi:hypothetical protein